MEKIVRQSMLYDFYGELLTEHQKNIYEDVVINDLSYSEIARLNGISRQGVYDMVKRCDKILEDYEEKLHLVEKFLTAKEKLTEITKLTAVVKAENQDGSLTPYLDEILAKSEEIFEEI
jgi:hypothetical protein